MNRCIGLYYAVRGEFSANQIAGWKKPGIENARIGTSDPDTPERFFHLHQSGPGTGKRPLNLLAKLSMIMKAVCMRWRIWAISMRSLQWIPAA